MSDAECLAELAGGERSEAFAFIVRRYAGLVYSTARRIVRQDQLAEDITQATFVALYRKAPSVDPRTLAGWLVNATRLTAMATMRSESRREKHETNAAILQRARDLASDEPTVNEIAPLLDELRFHVWAIPTAPRSSCGFYKEKNSHKSAQRWA